MVALRRPDVGSKELQQEGRPGYRMVGRTSEYVPTVLVQKDPPRVMPVFHMLSTGVPKVDQQIRDYAREYGQQMHNGVWRPVDTGEEELYVGINGFEIRLPKHTVALIPHDFFEEWMRKKLWVDPLNSPSSWGNAICAICKQSARACGCKVG